MLCVPPPPPQVARTEKVQNCLNPKFAKKFVIDYYFEMVQKLIFGIYDIDNKTVDLSDDDFLGQLEITLGQVGHGQRWEVTKYKCTVTVPNGHLSGVCTLPDYFSLSLTSFYLFTPYIHRQTSYVGKKMC